MKYCLETKRKESTENPATGRSPKGGGNYKKNTLIQFPPKSLAQALPIDKISLQL
jgi:hypothetical protein